MFCEKCGKILADNAKFCNYCGVKQSPIKDTINQTKDDKQEPKF